MYVPGGTPVNTRELLWHAGGAVAIVRPALSRQIQVPSSLDRVPSTFQEQREIMRKLFWCGSAAGVLALGSLFTATYYAYCEPDSFVSRCITTAANASLAVQPVTGLASMVAQASHFAMNP